MTDQSVQPQGTAPQPGAKLIRAAIWVAIGSLIAAALVCVVWVLVGTGNGLVGRAFLTILLLAAFAGVTILDTHLSASRPAWFTLVSMGSWIAALLIGAVMIWMPERQFSFVGVGFGSGIGRFFSFLLIVLILQLAVLHIRLYAKAIARAVSGFTRVIGFVTIGFVAVLAFLLVLPLMMMEWVEFFDFYWRVVVAVAILAAVGTAIVPLINALFAPRTPREARSAAPQAWPTYVDGVTPLPVLPDGSPDWQAYYTGYPTGYVQPTAQAIAPSPQGYQASAPAAAPAEQQHPASPAAAPTPAAAYVELPNEATAPSVTSSEPPTTPPAAPAHNDYPTPPPLPPR